MNKGNRSFSVLLIVTTMYLSACQSLQDVAESQQFTEPAGVTLMTESQLRETLVGNTHGGDSVKNVGNFYLEFVDPDGTIRGLRNGKYRYEGSWAIHGKVWCYKYASNSGCNTLSGSSNTIFWHNLDGSTDRGRSRVYPGNPRNL